jgi:hypothetical protein
MMPIDYPHQTRMKMEMQAGEARLCEITPPLY